MKASEPDAVTTRRCPRCTFTLVPHRPPAAMPGGPSAEVDVCPRCHGTFLDAGDAKAMLGDNAEPQTWQRTSAASFKGKGKLRCPDGHGALSVYNLQAPPGSGVDVDIDVCPECRGMWLDQWEAARVAQATRALMQSVAAPAVGDVEKKTGAGWYLFQLFSGMPVEEYNPVKRKPLVVLALIAACIIAFVVELSTADPVSFIRTFGVVPADLLAGRNVFSLVTHMFLHGGLAHIAANMWFLYTFGDNVEDRMGRRRFLVLYFVFGVVAALAQTFMSLGGTAPLVGASGAIAGLMGAYLMLFPRARVYQVLLFIRFKVPVFVYLSLWLLLQALLGYASLSGGAGAGVAWWAHLGGFVAGAVWGAFARARFGDGAELRATGTPG